MGILIIYYEHVKGFYQCGFCGEFSIFNNIIFKRKTFVLVLIFSTTFLPFFALDITTLFSYPFHPILLKFQLEFQTSYMNLKSIHI